MKRNTLRLLTLFALMLFMSPVQVSAAGLELPRLKPRSISTAGASPSVAFTGFRVLKGSGRTDWFVTVKNTSNANVARNVYEIRATQTNIMGTTSPAGTPFTLGEDLRPGRSMNLQRQFDPSSDISRITIEAIDTRSNRSIGSGTFSAAAAASGGPGAAQAGPAGNTAVGMSNAAANVGDSDPDRNKLELIIKEETNGMTALFARNVGTAAVDLAWYEFSLSGHLLFRPTKVETRNNVSGQLQPGTSKRVLDGAFECGCANFTHYTATARNEAMSQHYEARLDVAPPTVTLNGGRIGLHSTELSDLSVVTLFLEVTNTSSRTVRRPFAATGRALVKTDKGTCIIPFNVLPRDAIFIAPGVKRVVEFEVGIGSPSDQDMLFYEKKDLTFQKAKRIEVMVRLENPVDCGVPVILTPYKHVHWPAL